MHNIFKIRAYVKSQKILIKNILEVNFFYSVGRRYVKIIFATDCHKIICETQLPANDVVIMHGERDNEN